MPPLDLISLDGSVVIRFPFRKIIAAGNRFAGDGIFETGAGKEVAPLPVITRALLRDAHSPTDIISELDVGVGDRVLAERKKLPTVAHELACGNHKATGWARFELTFIRRIGETIAAVTLRLEVWRNSVALGALVVALDFHKDPSFVFISAGV